MHGHLNVQKYYYYIYNYTSSDGGTAINMKGTCACNE